MAASSALLQEFRIGPLMLRNRVVSTSHQTSLVHDHLPTDDLVAYHEARARGGVGAIFLEATAVHETGLLTAHTIAGYLPAIAPSYRRLGDAVRRHGTPLFVQLLHSGREQIATAPRPPAIAPSAVPSARFRSEPRALTLTEIRELIAGYATSARLAREGGVDGIEISMAHGYLVAQFIALSSNRRDDTYNGDLDVRLRFAREVLEAVRAAAGDGLAVGVRLSADEIAPGMAGPQECAAIAAALCADGAVDFVSAALGHSASYRGSTYIVPPPPEPVAAIAEPVRAMRAALGPGVPLIATSRVVDLDAAERLVASGAVDVVGMTRALIADPELVAKAAGGRADDTIPCVGCNQGCIGHYHAGVGIGCLVNPRTGRERRLTRPVRRSGAAVRRVLVAGGGPAGVAAALEAAAAGHAVVLAERGELLGGQLRIAGRAPAHRELWERYESWIVRRLAAERVDVRFATTVTDADVAEHDVVVIATGARPYRPPLPGLGCAVLDAPVAILDAASVHGPVLVADWGGGCAGLDAAEVLAEQGLDVALASAAATIGEDVHQYQRNLYLARLDRLGVRLLHHAELVADAPGGPVLRHVFSGRTVASLHGIGTLVLAQGREPDDDLWRSLERAPRGAAVVRAGDVLGPRSAEEAILEGTLAVRAMLGALN